MKEIMALTTHSLRLSRARCGTFFLRLALFATVVGVLVFVSIETASAHIDSLVPNQWTAGGTAFTLRMLGRDFDQSDTGLVLFNGTRVAATLISSGELQATIPANLLVSAGTVSVTLEGFNSVDFTINLPPTITTASPLPDGSPGFSYSQTLSALGGTTPFSWTSTGTLPAGLSLASAGVISGTPTSLGTFGPIIVTVTDVAGVSANKDFTLRIRLGCAYIVSPSSQSFPSGGGSGNVTVTAPPPPAVCNWTAVSNDPWIRITSGHSGSGNGTVNYSVDASLQARAGSLTIADATGFNVQSVMVLQAFPDCPPSAISISPESALFKPDAGQGIALHVTAPDDCLWVGVSSSPWIQIDSAHSTPRRGTGILPYELQVNSGFWRQGTITINGGVVHHVFQNGSGCALGLVCRFSPSRCITDDPSSVMSQSRSFRDEVLAKTPHGQRYTQLYYRFSTEAAALMMLSPSLIMRSREILERYRPTIASMIKGEQVTLTQGDIEEIDVFLNSYAAKGSPELRETIRGLCEDLRDQQLLTEFNITITDGPKREMPAQSTLEITKRTGLMIFPLGLLLFCIYRARPRCNKKRS